MIELDEPEVPTTPGVQFTGRFDFSDPDHPRFSWPGSRITVRFYGTDLDVRMRELPGSTDDYGDPHRNRYQIWVDGSPTDVLVADPKRERYRVARNLPLGEHTVVLSKRTEPLVGEAQFLGVDFPNGGHLLPPPRRSALRMEFIGDSIAAGYGVEGPNRNCHFTAETQNHDRAFAALTARKLGAEEVTIAWSGVGIWRNYDGSFGGTMPELYPLTRAPADVRWDFSTWTPHIVAINLGTNDFARVGVERRGFVSAYLDFIAQVRSQYPRAQIFVLMGPMLSDTYPAGQASLTLARTYLHEVVDTARSRGDARVHLVEFPEQDGTYGCDWHPNVAEQHAMADTLVQEIRSRLSW